MTLNKIFINAVRIWGHATVYIYYLHKNDAGMRPIVLVLKLLPLNGEYHVTTIKKYAQKIVKYLKSMLNGVAYS